MLISSTMERAVLISLLLFVFISRHRRVAVINAPSKRFFNLRFSALCCCKRQLGLCLIVSLGMVLVVSMPTDYAFVIAVIGVTKFTTWDGGAPTITVSLEPIFRIDRDEVDPSLTTIWDRCDATIEPSMATIWDKFDATILFFSLSIRFRYVSYLMSTCLNPAHFIIYLVCIPGAECISMLAAATQSKAGSYSPIEWLRFIFLVDDEWKMQYVQFRCMKKWNKNGSAAALTFVSWEHPKSISQTLQYWTRHKLWCSWEVNNLTKRC